MYSRKQQFEKDLTGWINEDSKRKAKYGHVLADLSALVAQSQEHNQRDLGRLRTPLTNDLNCSRLYRLCR